MLNSESSNWFFNWILLVIATAGAVGIVLGDPDFGFSAAAPVAGPQLRVSTGLENEDGPVMAAPTKPQPVMDRPAKSPTRSVRVSDVRPRRVHAPARARIQAAQKRTCKLRRRSRRGCWNGVPRPRLRQRHWREKQRYKGGEGGRGISGPMVWVSRTPRAGAPD